MRSIQTQWRHQPSETTFDLSKRLSESQLSLAWAHLFQADLTKPVPNSLSHLTEPEWALCSDLLEQNLWLKEQLPLQ